MLFELQYRMDRNKKRRMRQKIANRKAERTGGASAGSSVATAVCNDLASALLSMGLEDPVMLAQATQLVKRAAKDPSHEKKIWPNDQKCPLNGLNSYDNSTEI